MVARRRNLLIERLVPEEGLDLTLGIIEVAGNADYIGVVTLLSQHLQFLDMADAALRIEDHNLSAGHIRKAGHGRLTGIAGCGSQDDDFLVRALFLSRSGHEIRQDGQGHILEGDGLAMEELQIVGIPYLLNWGQFWRVELVAVIGPIDAGL